MSSTSDVGRAAVRGREVRLDIQGLRGVAVAAVIANHFAAKLAPNGFLGVDLFFVISGFVITGSLSRTQKEGYRSFLVTFYDRRVRRLMPALITCVAVTVAIGLPFIPPDFSYFGESWKTGLTSLFGVSNLYLYRRSLDYFAARSEFNLFTQTWSLAVEEQFYLLFPSVVWLTGFGRRGDGGRRRLLVVLAIASLVSLAAAFAVDRVDQSASFFLIPGRLWELGIGGVTFLVAPAVERRAGAKSPTLRDAALAALTAVLFVPGLPRLPATVVVCVLTAVVVALGQTDSAGARLLQSRPLVYLGLISYSLYLWHWTVLVCSRWTVGVSLATAPLQLAAVWLLAHASFRWIEQPLRRRSWLASPSRNIAAALSAAVVCAGFCAVLGVKLRTSLFLGDTRHNVASLAGTTASSGVSRSPAYSDAERQVQAQLRTCNMTPHHLTGKAYRPKPQVDRAFVSACTGGDRPKVVLVGDSFAEVIAPHVALAAHEVGRDFRVLIGYGWPYPLQLRNVDFATNISCEGDSEMIHAELLRNLNPGDVLVLRLFFGKPQYLSFDRGTFQRSRARLLAAYDAELLSLARQVSARGAHLLVIGGNPMLENSPICQSPQWFNRVQQDDCRKLTLHSSLVTTFALEHEQHVAALFQSASPETKSIGPTRLFCSQAEDSCSLVRDGEFLWADDSHIKPAAIDLFYPELVADLRAIVARQ